MTLLHTLLLFYNILFRLTFKFHFYSIRFTVRLLCRQIFIAAKMENTTSNRSTFVGSSSSLFLFNCLHCYVLVHLGVSILAFQLQLFNVIYRFNHLSRRYSIQAKRASIAYMESTVVWHFYSSSPLSNLFRCLGHVSPLF